MSFASLAAADGRGLWWAVEVSFDDFATVSYRWASHSGTVETNFYERRIIGLRDLTRGFGSDHLPASSNIDVELDNTDFGVDWLGDSTVFATQGVRARFRIRLGLWDVGVTTAVATQVVGYFVAMDQPTQSGESFVLTLTDDVAGQLDELLTPPTTNDWISASTSANNPLVGRVGAADPNVAVYQAGVDFNQPWPLMFGAGPVPGYMIAPGIPRDPVSTSSLDVLSTTGSNKVGYTAVTPGGVGNLISVTYNAPAGPVTSVAVSQVFNPDGVLQDNKIVVSPKAGETNAGVAAAIAAFGPSAALVTTTVVGPGDLVTTRNHAYLTGGFGVALTWVNADGTTASSPIAETADWRQILVCATAELSAVNAFDVTGLEVVYGQGLTVNPELNGQTLVVPQTAPGGAPVWKANKSATFTANGYQWRLLWIEFSVTNYIASLPNGTLPQKGSPGGGFGAGAADPVCAAIDHFNVFSYGALSAVTGKSNLTQNPVDVVQDLVQYYSPMRDFPGGPIDATRFARAHAARQSMSCRGIVSVPFATDISTLAVGAASPGGLHQATPGASRKLVYAGGLLRQALAEICSSFDIDLFLTLAGQAGVSAQVADFTSATATYPSLDEQKFDPDSVRVRVPSGDERWAPYNAVFITSAAPGNPELGPFRNQQAIAAWGGRVLAKHLEGTWWPYLTDSILNSQGPNGKLLAFDILESFVWSARSLESAARRVVTFDTDFTWFALGVDLGDDFLFTWTRGGNSAVFSSSLMRCDGMVIHFDQAKVSVTAVYMDDLRTAKAYLLDDETLLTRVASSGGRTATVVDGSTTVTFASGSLVTDGVAAGDQLILKDATEAANSYSRNRALRIASITDATHLVVTGLNTFTDFGGGAAVATWEIRRGQPTYPTSVSDPTHYPSGGGMYGKVSTEADLYNSGAAANLLLDG